MPTGIYKRTKETKKKISKAMSGKNNPMYGVHRFGSDSPMYGKRHSKEAKQKMSNSQRDRGMSGKNNPFYNHKHSEKSKRKIGEKNSGKIPWIKGLTKETDERVAKISKKLSIVWKQLWQTSDFVKKQMKSRGVRPNKPELKLNTILQQFLPGEYKYVGDGEFILAGKCPDFININGQKKIIELFGNYWHKGETGKDRINLFKQYGYETLIVWEKELEDIENLKEIILNFHSLI